MGTTSSSCDEPVRGEIHDFDKDHQEQLARRGIWWLASYPKSGNTWIRMFLNAAISQFPVRLNSAYQYSQGDNAVIPYQSVCSLPISKVSPVETLYMRPAMLIGLLHRAVRDILLKTHHANLSLDGMPLCPPKISKGALYVVRDPRDVCVSFAKHIGEDIDHTIKLMNSDCGSLKSDEVPYFHFLQTWSTHVKSWLDKRNVIPTSCVKYEDMVCSPVKTFTQIPLALGIELSEEQVMYGLEQSEFSKLKGLEQTNGFREVGCKQDTFFNTGRIGRWKDVLTDRQVAQIEEDHGEMMQILGYELSMVSTGV